MTDELAVSSTRGIAPGMTMTMAGSASNFRVVRVNGNSLIITEVLSWWRRLWRYLTTAPNGDATAWMRHV